MNAPSLNFDAQMVDPQDFRQAMGQFATGVTIVTCSTPDGPLGITANSFASVSLDPPLVLWSPAKASKRYPAFVAAQHFAIHVMSEDQADLCARFAKDGYAFAGLDWETSPVGVPLLMGCLSRFECRRETVHDGGDHSIIVGRVARVTTNKGTPLIFSGGKYGAFSQKF